MALDFRAVGHKTWQSVASVPTGVVRLILVMIFAAACLVRDLHFWLESGERI